jgi:hypothetical protein
MKSFIVDTTASIIFFTIVAGFSELFVAGMDLQQVLAARLIMIPVMVATGRPYGVWRDWLISKLQPGRSSTKTIVDIIAFLNFQVPVYLATLAVAGASAVEMGAAVSAAIVFMVLLSRPFGLFLELIRRWAGTAAT